MSNTQSRPYIVIVDDDPDDIELLSSSLERKGLTVQSFLSGEKAMQYLKTCRVAFTLPSLIILDYNIPKNNGGDILKWLKNNAQTHDIPVIMYSTTISADLEAALVKSGAYKCLEKPRNHMVFLEYLELFKNIAVPVKRLSIN